MRHPILFALLSFLIVTVGHADAESLVSNGDFNEVTSGQMPADWHKQSWGPPTGDIQVVASDDPQRGKVLSIRHDDQGQQTFLVQSVKLQPGQEYILSYFIRTRAVQGDKPHHGGMIYLLDSGKTLFSIGQSLYRHATGTMDWQRVEHHFRTPTLQKETCSLVLALRQASGEVQFDDVRLVIKPKPEPVDLKVDLYPLDFQHDVLHLPQRFPLAILLRMLVNRDLIGHHPLQMVLELPEGIEYVGSSPLLPEQDAQKDIIFPINEYEKKSISRDGRPYVQYTVTFSPWFTHKLGLTYAWENYTRIYLKSSRPAGQTLQAYWRLRTPERELQDGRFTLVTLPPIELPSEPAKRFQLNITRPWNTNAPGDVSEEYVRFWTSLQASPWLYEPYHFSRYPEQEKQRWLKAFGFIDMVASNRSMPWFGPLYQAVAQKRFGDALPPSVGIDGKPLPNTLSPWYMIEDPDDLVWGTLFKEYADHLKTHKPHVRVVAINYEPGAMGHCFSEQSRERFRAYMNLEVVPSITQINARYRLAWLEFRIQEHRQIIARISQAVREHLPGIEFWLISDPLQTGSQRVSEWCGVDVAASDSMVDIHQHMPYISGIPFYEQVGLNIRELKAPFFPLIDPSENMAMYYHRYTPEKVIQNIFAVGAQGGVGIGFWPNDIFDGAYLHAISRAYGAMAQVEDFYFDGSSIQADYTIENTIRLDAGMESQGHIHFPPLDQKLRVLAHRQGDEFLLTVFNYSDNHAAVLRVSFVEALADRYQVQDMLSRMQWVEDGRPLAGERVRQGFLVEVQAHGTSVIRLTPSQNAGLVDSASPLVEQATLESRVRQFRDSLASHDMFKAQAGSGSTVTWALLPDTQEAVLYLNAGEAKLGLAAFDDGRIVSWQFNDKPDLLFHNGRGFLDRFSLNAPEQTAGLYRFELAGLTHDEGNPGVSFTSRVSDFQNASAIPNPLAGLKIVRSVVLLDAGRRFRVTYEFSNPADSGRTMAFSFKQNNYPKLGAAYLNDQQLCEITTIQSGDVRFTPGQDPSQRLLLRTSDAAEELRQNPLFARLPVQTITPGEIHIHAGQAELRIKPMQDYAGFYSWSNTQLGYTAEPVSDMIRLEPGQSHRWGCEFEARP